MKRLMLCILVFLLLFALPATALAIEFCFDENGAAVEFDDMLLGKHYKTEHGVDIMKHIVDGELVIEVSVPKTGDASHAAGFIGILCILSAGILAEFIRRKQQNT